MRWSCAARSWWVPPIEGPSLRRTSAVAFSATDGECESTSDAPCHRTPMGRNPSRLSQDPFHRRLVKGQRLSRPRAPSIDECSLGAAFATPRTRARHPEFSRTLPSWPGFRRFFASRKRKARHRRFRGLIARERSAPRAARRLLQSKPFASTTDGSTKLQAFLGEGSTAFAVGFPSRPGPAGLLAKERDRGVMGQRPAFLWQCLPAPLGAIARVRGLCPNPIGSDTPCHAPAAFVAGVATTPFEHAIARRLRASRPTSAFTVVGEGRLPKPSAKKAPFRCTRGAFHLRTSPWRGGAFFSTHCPQPVDYGPCAFSILARSGTLTRVRGPRRLNPLDEGGG